MGAKKSTTTTVPTMRVRQLRSGIGFRVDQKATLRALGLGKIGRVRELPDTPQTRGMVAKVSHLVTIESADGESDKKATGSGPAPDAR